MLSFLLQAVGAIVNAAAASVSNATVTLGSDELACEIVDTRRIYDPEAVNVFGNDFLAFQVHVLQHVNVTSDQPLWLEQVVGILETGFGIQSGGRVQFRSLLRDFSGFETVIAVEVKDSLSPIPIGYSFSPSAQPTEMDTPSPTPEPTYTRSATPSIAPTKEPTPSPTSTLSLQPTMHPTEPPTSAPSMVPSSLPSVSPTGAPTAHPSSPPTPAMTSLAPTGSATEFIPVEPVLSPTMWALIVGAAAIALSCGVICFLFWRRRDEKVSRAKQALAVGGGWSRNVVPGVVELDDDQRSLAETTLGEQTAGRSAFKPTKTVLPHPQPLIARDKERSSASTTTKKKKDSKKVKRVKRRTTAATSKVKRSDSFDEESLYTTPFSLKRNDSSPRTPKLSPSAPSHLDSKLMLPLDYEDKILFPMSDHNTDSSDGMFSHSGPISVDQSVVTFAAIDPETKEKYAGTRTGPIDLDTEEPFDDYIVDTTSLGMPREDGQQQDGQGGSSAVDKIMETVPHSMDSFDEDNWSYASIGREKEGVDQSKSSYLPRSPSYSSKSTAKTGNITRTFLRAPDVQQQDTMLAEDKEEVGSTHSRVSVSTSTSKESKSTLTGQPPKYQVSSLMSALEANKPSQAKSHFQSPLMRLLEKRKHSLPAVTPEGNEEDTEIEDSASPGDMDGSKHEIMSTSTDATGMSNSWLFEKVGRTLGPRSTVSDSEAFTSRTDLSKLSRAGGSEVSFSSRRSNTAVDDMDLQPRSLEHDLRRLGQVALLEGNERAASSITGSGCVSLPSLPHRTTSSHRKKIIVAVPPGKLGVILANRHDGNGTVVAEVRDFSSLKGMLSPGDRLVGVDEVDVTPMVVSQITSLMASRSDKVRRLTVITNIQQQHSTIARQEPKTRVVF